jgi:cob(I)alamin adenosyltransferase
MKGYIHIYTGNGKGKTTAALGLALRAAGAGKKVFIGQFIKGKPYSEMKVLEKLPNIDLEQFGRDCFIYQKPTKEDVEAAQKGLDIVKGLVQSKEYDLLILDELTMALYYGLFPLVEVIDLLKNKTRGLEIVITGRQAPQELIELADLVTEMKEVKHYYQRGIEGRKGIEF